MGGQEGASAVNDTGPGGPAPGVDPESLKAFAASSASSGVNLAVLQPGGGGTTNSQGQDNGYAAALAAFIISAARGAVVGESAAKMPPECTQRTPPAKILAQSKSPGFSCPAASLQRL